MGKFSAAKMNGASDIKFQNAYNKLIDLLETGYVSESMLGGHKVRVDVNPRDGMQITIDEVRKFFVGTDGRVYATSIGNAEGSYAEIGVHIDHGGGYGMDLYNNGVLFCSLDVLADGGFALYDQNDRQRYTAEMDNTRLYDENGSNIFWSNRTISGGFSQIMCPTNDNYIGTDATGCYKINDGIKTYL